jgi:uncharacterized membrane protein
MKGQGPGSGWPFTPFETLVMVLVGAVTAVLINTIGLIYGLLVGVAVGLIVGLMLKRKKERKKTGPGVVTRPEDK